MTDNQKKGQGKTIPSYQERPDNYHEEHLIGIHSSIIFISIVIIIVILEAKKSKLKHKKISSIISKAETFCLS